MKIGPFGFDGFWMIFLLSCLVLSLAACIWLTYKVANQLEEKGYGDEKAMHWIVGLFAPVGIGIICLALLAINSPDKTTAKGADPINGPSGLPKL